MDKGKALNNSKPFIDALWSDAEEVDNLVNIIVKKVKSHLSLKRFSQSKYSSNTKVILLNLFVTREVKSNKYLAYSRDANWSNDSRYRSSNIGYDVYISIVDTLIELKYVTNHKGFYDGIVGMRSRMRATPKLVKLFKSNNISTAMIVREKSEEVIILRKTKDKDGYKETIDYKDTDTTNQMRSSLVKINELLANTWIDLEVPDVTLVEINERLERKKDKQPIDFTRRKLKRIFSNSSFEQGGRFYHGWWQEIPSEYRKYITINGKWTRELDYAGIHIRMMYAMEGEELDDSLDPYELKDYSNHRGEVKQALNTIINAKTKQEALGSIANNLTLPKGRDANDLYKQLEQMHPKIRHYFGTGEGIKLQHLDSKIAEIVMLELLEQGIVALPVHDSFIVRRSHMIDLNPIMREAFKQVVKVKGVMELKDLSPGATLINQKKKPLVEDQEQFPGVREAFDSKDMWEIINNNKYKKFQQREGEWNRKDKELATIGGFVEE
ncbi:MAG: hypothetical protein HOJ52_04845 [Candidatus Thioglobus sp.]|nr:hypothetical protein [Candidatus Thioglobus sp.]